LVALGGAAYGASEVGEVFTAIDQIRGARLERPGSVRGVFSRGAAGCVTSPIRPPVTAARRSISSRSTSPHQTSLARAPALGLAQPLTGGADRVTGLAGKSSSGPLNLICMGEV